VNAASGTVVGNPISPTFGPPQTLVYDWTNDLIWIGYGGSFTLSSIRASDGSQSPYGASLNFGPYAMAFDGQYVWLANSTSSGDNLVKALGSDPTTQQGPFSIGNQPFSLAFDGQYMWVANRAGNTVDKLQLGNAASVGAPFPLSLPDGPNTIYFDGTYMWVGALYSNTVTKLSLAGAVLATYEIGTSQDGSYPSSMAFDGTYLWVVTGNANTLAVLDVSTGAVWMTPQLTPNLVNLLFDGTYMWLGVIEGGSSTPVGQVFRLSAIFQ
jgi:DNA-binding beta-propeller fold protein YncE